MKRYLIIPGALLAFILFSAKSCDENQQASREQDKEALIDVMDRVKNGFQADSLDEEILDAFTQKAKQKLKDYSEYMNIVTDSSSDSAFRMQALSMTHALFYRSMGPSEFFPGQQITIDSIWLIESMHLSEERIYKGIIGFREKIIQKTEQDSVPGFISLKKAEILGVKSSKEFGNDTLQIWQVYLGKIF
ncbi:MAG: hypothetical protein JXA23_04250 [Bacteroidales bacterium]|nr:hypothetical protein [Bacteroidales bacterium]